MSEGYYQLLVGKMTSGDEDPVYIIKIDESLFLEAVERFNETCAVIVRCRVDVLPANPPPVPTTTKKPGGAAMLDTLEYSVFFPAMSKLLRDYHQSQHVRRMQPGAQAATTSLAGSWPTARESKQPK